MIFIYQCTHSHTSALIRCTLMLVACMQEQALILRIAPLALQADDKSNPGQSNKDKSKAIIIGCVAALFVALVAAILGGVMVWGQKRHRPSSAHVCPSPIRKAFG
jgi:hypothetical protein